MTKKGIKALFIMTAITLLIAAAFLVYGCDSKPAYEQTVGKMAKVDEKYGMKIKDYLNGMDYLWLHPRYPKPTNAEDIPGIISEFESIRSEAMQDRPSGLLLNARVHLLEAEKFYKLYMKYPIKGHIEDGFSCSEINDVMDAANNLNLSVQHGRIAMANFSDMNRDYAKEADMVDISPHWVRAVNETFDELSDRADKSVNVMRHFCLNETTEDDAALDKEFSNVKDAMREAQIAAYNQAQQAASSNRSNSSNK